MSDEVKEKPKIFKKIILEWEDTNGDDHSEEMDTCFKSASKKTFNELRKVCVNYIENHLNEFGRKEWIIKYVPYKSIKYYENNKLVCWFYAREYLEKILKGGRR